MNWIKEVVVDLIVTMVILVAVLTNLHWLGLIVIGYTLLMLLLKGIVALNHSLIGALKPRKSEAPEWVTHLLYGVNSLLLLAFGWWITGVQWVAIWILSWHTERQLQRTRQVGAG